MRLAGDAGRLEQLGDRELGNAVRRMAYQLDAEAWVTLRPAPDVMSRLSAALPVAPGVAVIRTLGDHADSPRAAGDPRTRSQLMADTCVSRLLGVEQTDALPVTFHVAVADDVLFGHEEDAAHLDDFGPVPVELVA